MWAEHFIESMHEQVRAIHRALTGEDAAEPHAELAQRFAELENVARSVPAVAARVPPFTFTPPIDIVACGDVVIVEVALPGVDREDVAIEIIPGALVISGLRRDRRAASGGVFHAEIARGPFSRTVPLPVPTEHEPFAELDRGVLRIHLRPRAAIVHHKPEPEPEQNQEKV